MERRVCAALGAAIAGLLWAPGSVWSSNGYFPHGWGARSSAMTGAGAALTEDAMIAATNPAGIAALPRNERVVGLSAIKANPGYVAGTFEPPQQAPAAGSFPLLPRSDHGDPEVPNNVFWVPQLAASLRLDARSAVGLAVYANGGLNATYSDFDNPICPEGTSGTGVYCGGIASNDLSQVFVAPTYAVQLNDALRIGASLILALQSIEVRGLSAFAPLSQRPDRLTDQGHELSYGYGLKLGVQARLAATLQAAAVLQTRVDMSRLRAYEGLLADSGEFDVPPYLTLALAWTPEPAWAIAADVQRIAYSQIRALGNDLDAPGALGARDGPGFGWDDVTAYKLGLRYAASPQWALRAGFSYTEQPVDRNQLFFNILAGSVFKRHYALGFSYRRPGGDEFDLSLMWGPEQRQRGPNPLYPEQSLEVSLEGMILDFSWRGLF